ncbi:hypothetical protein U3516DRAFT_909267, partial [Neocallimastix sp. 'constans']
MSLFLIVLIKFNLLFPFSSTSRLSSSFTAIKRGDSLFFSIEHAIKFSIFFGLFVEFKFLFCSIIFNASSSLISSIRMNSSFLSSSLLSHISTIIFPTAVLIYSPVNLFSSSIILILQRESVSTSLVLSNLKLIESETILLRALIIMDFLKSTVFLP